MGLFADELYKVLLAHRNDDYAHLGGGPARGDPIWHPLRLVPIPPPVIQRLKQATHAPDKMAQLNAHSLQQTVQRLGYSDDDYLRLRAALLAESVSMYLRNRMEPEEAPIIDAITRILHSELLGRLRPITERIRGGTRENEMELALTFIDRAGELADAADMAQRRQDEAMAVFWGKLARVAYEQAASLLSRDSPDFAAEITRLINDQPQ